jgi:hypothetical protein
MMEQQLIAGLMARGFSEPQAKGIVANMIAESRLNPGINEAAPLVPGSRGGYGLNQWTGPRRRQYEAFAAERGAALDDVNTQLDFTMWEFQNTERPAYEALLAADDPVEAARVYSERFLRPGIPHMDRRLAEAARLGGMEVGGYATAAAAPQAPGEPQQNALAPPPLTVSRLDPAAFQRPQNRLALQPLTQLRRA